MSLLEEALQEQKSLQNKGYSVEQVQCAALQIIANELGTMKYELGRVSENLANLEMSCRGTN